MFHPIRVASVTTGGIGQFNAPKALEAQSGIAIKNGEPKGLLRYDARAVPDIQNWRRCAFPLSQQHSVQIQRVVDVRVAPHEMTLALVEARSLDGGKSASSVEHPPVVEDEHLAGDQLAFPRELLRVPRQFVLGREITAVARVVIVVIEIDDRSPRCLLL